MSVHAKVQVSNPTYNLQYMMLFWFLLSQYVHYLQRNYSLGSFNLLGHTAPALAVSLLLVGSFLDCWLTGKRVYAYDYTLTSAVSFFSFLYYYLWLYLSWYDEVYFSDIKTCIRIQDTYQQHTYHAVSLCSCLCPCMHVNITMLLCLVACACRITPYFCL